MLKSGDRADARLRLMCSFMIQVLVITTGAIGHLLSVPGSAWLVLAGLSVTSVRAFTGGLPRKRFIAAVHAFAEVLAR